MHLQVATFRTVADSDFLQATGAFQRLVILRQRAQHRAGNLEWAVEPRQEKHRRLSYGCAGCSESIKPKK